jgi:hypothetical protein
MRKIKQNKSFKGYFKLCKIVDEMVFIGNSIYVINKYPNCKTHVFCSTGEAIK